MNLRCVVSFLALLAAYTVPMVAQGKPAEELPPPEPGRLAVDPNAPADKRAFGVLPNYRTAEMNGEYHPITAKRKLTIAVKDSFDTPLMVIGSIYAGLYQLEDTHPQFGQGTKGYLKRFGTSYTDQVIGNMLTEGIMPIAFHEDPRYFRMSEGSKKKRVGYALSRIFVTRTDANKPTFNFAEVVGNGVGTLATWSYYTDTRNTADYFQGFGQQLATDAMSQVLKEFWPDVKRYLHRRHQNALTRTGQ